MIFLSSWYNGVHVGILFYLSFTFWQEGWGEFQFLKNIF